MSMARLRRKRKQEDDRDAGQDPGSAPSEEQADDLPALARVEGSGLQPRLERKWEEAFRRARSR